MTRQKPTIAITGANGFLGSALVRHFEAEGWKVLAFVRNSKNYTSTPLVSYVEYSFETPLAPSALRGVEYVVHTAYIKQDARHPNALQANVVAARELVAAARKQRVKKLLFMSTLSAHDEAESVYGKQKLAVEKIFDGKDSVIIRSGLILGDGGIVRQMFNFMRSKHLVPLIGGGKQPLQIVAVYDLVRVIQAALTSDRTGLYTIATPEVYTYKEFYLALSKRFKIRVFFVPVPFWLLLSVIRTINFLRIPLAVNPDNVLGLKHLKSSDTAHSLGALGLTLDTLDEALKNMRMSE